MRISGGNGYVPPPRRPSHVLDRGLVWGTRCSGKLIARNQSTGTVYDLNSNITTLGLQTNNLKSLYGCISCLIISCTNYQPCVVSFR